MCGIMGYVGSDSASKIVFDGLKRLEYRGYDSAGIAVLGSDRNLYTIKAQGKLKELEPLLKDLPSNAVVGIGHTRWATHGPPVTRNAHPHVAGEVAMVHNGIIENFADLKAGLEAAGVEFKSDTDTEVVLHLFCRELDLVKDPREAILRLIKKIRGAFSLGILVGADPTALYLVKQGSPLVIGLGEGESFFASDAAAIVSHTTKAVFLNDGEIARLDAKSVAFWNFEGKKLDKTPQKLEWNADSVEKQGYAHYMLKETHEQPAVIRNLISRVFDLQTGSVNLDVTQLDKLDLKRVKHVNIVACGTAYLSGCVARYGFEKMGEIPTNVELASEFRYRKPFLNTDSLTILVSQSGETADTLECAKYARSQGSQVYGVCNVKYSSITRECSGSLMMEAGPEIGVASTKAFTAMVISLYAVACALAKARGKVALSDNDVSELRALPAKLETVLNKNDAIKLVAEKFYSAKNFLFIGRGEHSAIASEGALKLKEISYIHAEAYAAGELKHGPIALVDPDMPVMAIATDDFYFEKVVSNIEQVNARGAKVVVICNESDNRLDDHCVAKMSVPRSSLAILQAVISVVPLQLFAYHVACLRGTDVDQPRNLAKSVTVE